MRKRGRQLRSIDHRRPPERIDAKAPNRDHLSKNLRELTSIRMICRTKGGASVRRDRFRFNYSGSFVEPGVHKLAANSLLDTSDSQVFMAYFRRAGLDRTADMKPVFPDARLNQFKGIFDPFVPHGARGPFTPQNRTMSNDRGNGSDKLRWHKWLGQKTAVGNTLRGPPVGMCCGDVENGKGRVDLSGQLRDLPSIKPAQQCNVDHEPVVFALVSLEQGHCFLAGRGDSRFKTAICKRVFNDNLNRGVVFDNQDNGRLFQRMLPPIIQRQLCYAGIGESFRGENTKMSLGDFAQHRPEYGSKLNTGAHHYFRDSGGGLSVRLTTSLGLPYVVQFRLTWWARSLTA